VVPTEAKMANPVSMFMGLHKSKMIVVKLSALFMLDSFGGSFVLQSIMSDWFYMKYVLITSDYSLLSSMVLSFLIILFLF
jgi:hypothetical protein